MGWFLGITVKKRVAPCRCLDGHVDTYTVTPSIDKTLHKFFAVTDLDLITEFDLLPNCAGFP